MNRIVKQVVLPLLPTGAHLWLRARKQAAKLQDHRDVEFVTITPELVFETCWKDVAAGRGPSLIVWFEHRRILKFDCFGKDHGHYHISLPGHSARRAELDRLFLPEKTIEAQIERVLFELRTNILYYLARAPYHRARWATIPESALIRGIEQSRTLMYRNMASARAHGSDPVLGALETPRREARSRPA